MQTISFVVPVYNEETVLLLLRERINELAAYLAPRKLEFVLVNDGSTDNTGQILDSWASVSSNIRVLHLSRNFGALIAVRAGLSRCNGDCAYVMPADIQEPLELVEDMLRAWENGAEVVFSVPQNRVEVGIHRIFAKLFHRLFQRFVSRVPPAYTYLIDRKVLNELRGIREVNANLVALIYWMGYRQEIIDFIKRERSGGKSKWTFGRKLKLVIDSFVGFSYLPLRIISYAGLLLSFLAAGYAISIIVSKLLYGTAVQGWASLMVVIIAMFGILFFFLGIIGEYLWRVLDEARSRPLYIIRQDTFSIRRDGITIQSKKDGEADL